jgi:hypothetical protein
LLTLAATTVGGRAADLVRISEDPYTNPESQHRTEVEPAAYGFESTLVTAFQVGRVFNGGASNIGFATSQDNGASWTSGFLPGITVHEGGSFGRVSDPSVAYDAMHDVWLISSLGLQPTAVVISRSSDGGLGWSGPITVVTGSLDKNWTVCDNWPASPFYGNCYNEWDDTASGNLMQMDRSGDGGLTWEPPLSTADAAQGLGGQPLVQPDGTVVVPYLARGGSIRSFASHDGGGTWEESVLVDTVFHHSTVGLRSPAIPSAGLDAGGNIYVAWADCRYREGCAGNDIVISTSAEGAIWSSPARVPIDDVSSGADHGIPGLGVDLTTKGAGAHLSLAYYFYPVSACTVATCQLFAGFISSADGGQTWTDPQPLTSTPMQLSWLADTNQGRMVGDYIATPHAADGSAHPIIAVAGPPNALFDEAMHTPVAGLRTAGTIFAGRTSRGDRPVVSVPPASSVPATLN